MTGKIAELFCSVVQELYNTLPEKGDVNIQKTRPEFKGDYTINVFPYLRVSKKKPEDTAKEIGEKMLSSSDFFSAYDVIKGFLNLTLADKVYNDMLAKLKNEKIKPVEKPCRFVVEFSSPNTNKPLHLGHVRNNLLGNSICEILKAVGHEVIKVNLVNDRGVHICKSMLAWQKWGNGITPESSGIKGDRLVGDMYVRFSQELKKETDVLIAGGLKAEEAEKKTELMANVRSMLQDWEAGKAEVRELWALMNGWVYKGFEETYGQLGISFDKTYYESQTYLSGKDIVQQGVEKGVFSVHPDGSVRIDLTPDGLDEKVLLRSDGTSVYITQDLGTAVMRQQEYGADEMVYVVGNEQNYHFQVLKLVLKKLGYEWADKLFHLSYGMVELPEGKMKSREGTVVDADDLIAEMINTARTVSEESGKLKELSEDEQSRIYDQIAKGALKYFILKVEPKKGMLFNPRESIDFEGNTGPFVQYTHARICSVLRKVSDAGIKEGSFDSYIPAVTEREILKHLYAFSENVRQSAAEMNPGNMANYIFALAKLYNQFYHECPVLREENESARSFRMALSNEVARILKEGMKLLGMEAPERM